MTRRLRIAGCVLALVIVGVFILALLGGNSSEPVYQGKTLSLWLDDYFHSRWTSHDPVARKNAEEAVRQIGTNAIPTLLKMMRAQNPSPRVLKLLELDRSRRLAKILYPRSAFQRHDQALEAFRILNTNAACAVPELIEICDDSRYPTSQESAMGALAQIGPAAKAAIPVLLRNFTNKNARLRAEGLTAFCAIEGDANIVVPAIKGMLKDPNQDVRLGVAIYLRNGSRIPAVRSAIPELLEALQDPALKEQPDLKEQVENALWDLAPEKIAKPLVVEDATPMVTNGVTTEALSHEAYGELRTVIPRGKAVRCSRYDWTRSPVRMYRGPTSTTNDHFLGRFEVVGTPTNSSAEVEFVFIVDHRQILLCARDYSRKQFVELRRVEYGPLSDAQPEGN
jgi:hypothetical protein